MAKIRYEPDEAGQFILLFNFYITEYHKMAIQDENTTGKR